MSSFNIFTGGTTTGTTTINEATSFTNSGGYLNLTTAIQYAQGGSFTLSSAVPVSIVDQDRLDLTFKVDNLTDYFTITFNANYNYTVQIRVSPDMVGAGDIDFSVSLPPSFVGLTSITSFRIANYSPGTLHLKSIAFVQTDAGTLRPTESTTYPTINGLPSVPTNHIFRADISALPIHAMNTDWSAGRSAMAIHVDFGAHTTGSTLDYGIPINYDNGTLTIVNVSYTYNETDVDVAAAFPYKTTYKIEYGSDKHLIVYHQSTLYETWLFEPSSDATATSYHQSQGGTGTRLAPYACEVCAFDINVLGMRPFSWTGSSASGLPLAPLLIKYEDVSTGDLAHMSRLTFGGIVNAIWPASHKVAGNYPSCSLGYGDWATAGSLAPMGAIMRLKASKDISSLGTFAQRIARGWKKYGVIVDDIGGNFFVSGTPDSRWNDTDLLTLQTLTHADFEYVDVSGIAVNPASYKTTSVAPTPTPTPSPTPSPSPTTSPTTTSGVNLRILNNNRTYAGTLTASSTASGFPVTNLLDNRKSKYHRSVGTSQTLSVVFSVNETINCVHIPKGNFSPIATFRLRLYSDTSGTAQVFDSGNLTVTNPSPWPSVGGQILPSGGDGFAYGGGVGATIWVDTAVPTNVRKLVLDITDSANPDGHLDISQFICGNTYQTVYMPSLGISVGWATSTVISRNEAGDAIANLGYKFKQLTFDLSVMPEEDRAYMFALLRNNSLDLPIFVFPFYNSSVPQKAEDYSIWGRLTELTKIKLQTCSIFTTSISLEEM